MSVVQGHDNESIFEKYFLRWDTKIFLHRTTVINSRARFVQVQPCRVMWCSSVPVPAVVLQAIHGEVANILVEYVSLSWGIFIS